MRYVRDELMVNEAPREQTARKGADQVLDDCRCINNNRGAPLFSRRISTAAVPMSTRPRASIRLFSSSIVGVEAARLSRRRVYSERLCPDCAARDFRIRETSSGTFLICRVVMQPT